VRIFDNDEPPPSNRAAKPAPSSIPSTKETSVLLSALKRLARPVEDQARLLKDTEEGRVWAEASYLLDLMTDAAKVNPTVLADAFGSLPILTRHMNRLHDEVTDVINNNRSTANLERCLRSDLKMISMVTTLEKALGVEVGGEAAQVA